MHFEPRLRSALRDELAGSAGLTDAEVAAISKRLARLDAASKRGPWTTDPVSWC